MNERMFHRFADGLLARLIRMSPTGLRDWGAAIRGELAQVAGERDALLWALGGGAFLLRRIVADRFKSLVRKPGLAGGGSLSPAREDEMQKSVRWIAVACLGLSFLFLLAPAFRQALDVTVSGWRVIFGGWRMSAGSLNRLAEQARRRGDAAGLAFVAMRLPPGEQSARLADEAVRMDRQLTWIYVALVNASLPDSRAAEWIKRLEAWDPGNAVPHLLDAGRFTVGRYPRGTLIWTRPPLENPSWQAAMAAAFLAPKYDSYLARGYELDRAVIRNYGFGDPLRLVTGESARSPYMAMHLAREYAQSCLIEPAERLESKGKTGQAARLYWTAAHFAERVRMDTVSESERDTAERIQIAAYEHLSGLAEKSGNADESALLKYQVAQSRRYKRSEDMVAAQAYRWYAMVTQVSFLILSVAGAMVVAWGLYEAARRRKPALQTTRLDGLMRMAGMIAAAVVFACCVALYVSYRPYAERFSQFTSNRAFSDFSTLRVFLNFGWFPASVGRLWNGSVIQLYFWWIVVAGSVLVLAGISLRHIAHARKAHLAE